MRVIEVESKERSNRWLLWLVAGSAVGITVGVLAAEKYSGRRPNMKKWTKRLRGVATLAGRQWGPLVDLALELKDQWDERRASRPVPGDAAHDHDLEDEEYEDADEYAEAEAPLDEDFGDDFEDEELGMEVESQIAKRVLEAFIHDPILAERSLEIEADDDGDVVLHGSVRSPSEVAHAVTLARGVPGVTRVRQLLSVRARR
jgi:hypothetical protein